MNPSAPRVSIGMPVYNGEKYIEEAIRSNLAQTYDLLLADLADRMCRIHDIGV